MSACNTSTAITTDLRVCTLCPRACGVDRTQTTGLCGMGAALRVALAQLHFGEEPCLSGTTSLETGEARGSGTIFFSGCSLRCVYCQNHHISMGGPKGAESKGAGIGLELSVDDLTALMLELQGSGAHNVNLVTPTHFTPLVRQALVLARANGLCIPVVWNSSAYETVETLRSMEGLVDIFLPDLRYMDAAAAARYSGAPDYPAVACAAIVEMHRQVGQLVVEDGPGGQLARRGLLIRLLALPGNAGRADLALDWIAEHLGSGTSISLMGQYYPTHRAQEFPEINRGLKPIEYLALRRHMEKLGFANGFVQQVGSSASFTPDFLQGQG